MAGRSASALSFPSVQWLGHGLWQAPAGSNPGEATLVSDSGIDARRPYAKDPTGPDLQPLLPGLPNTPLSACQELILAAVVQLMRDEDLTYITSPVFIHHLLYIGLDPDAALQVKIAYLQGKVRPDFYAGLHAPRRVSADVGA